MAYAGDRLYNEVIRKKMADLATRVKVREIVAYLHCLTISDQEEIEAKRETAGNYSAMMLLLDNLRRRENWPDQFISALIACEQRTLANELREAYDRIRGIHSQSATAAPSPPLPPAAATAASVSPAAPPAPAPAPADAAPSPGRSPAEASASVTMATIHSVPKSTPPLLTPSVEASAVSATPSPINSPPGPYPNIAAPGSIQAPALVSAPDAPVHPPPESTHPAKPPLSVLVPNARPPSPVCSPTLTPSNGQREVSFNSRETSKLGTSAASAPTNTPPESCSNKASPALTEAAALVSAVEVSVEPPHEPTHPTEPLLVLAPPVVPLSPISTPKVSHSVGQSEVPVSSRQGVSGGLNNTALSAAPTLPTNPTSYQVNKPATTSQSSASPEKSKVPVAVVESASSVKHPIQETKPPGTVLPQDSQNNPTISQFVERVHTAVLPSCQAQETSQRTAQASPSTSTNAVAGHLSNFAAENEENFSKPGVLGEEEPFSGTSDDLQISHMTTEHLPVHPARPQAHRAEEPVDESVSVTSDDLMISSSTTAVQSVRVSDPNAPVQNSTPRALGDGFPEGDSNSYPNQPVEDHYESGIGVHIVEVSEGPSVQNLNGQPPSMIGPTTIGLRDNGETENLVQSISEDASQHFQGISQCLQGSNTSEQASPAAVLTTYAEPAPDTFQESKLNASGQVNIPQSEQKEKSKRGLHRFLSTTHIIAAAAAIGMTAAFVFFKHKK